MDQASVALRSVVKTFVNPNDGSDVEVIRQVDEDVQRAEFVCLLGPSGCGKSTLLEIIGGLQSATRGEIYILGKKVTSPHPDAAMVFQEDSLFPWRSVLGNLEFGMEARGIPRKERREKAREI
ncbi:MAG TPA: ATP-binding cassette domain-containing protein, partial [Dehalococcoidia bacterium]|nr:ATP-binding cassette domain-containing protein [Dehalococcoidia bacterium]